MAELSSHARRRSGLRPFKIGPYHLRDYRFNSAPFTPNLDQSSPFLSLTPTLLNLKRWHLFNQNVHGLHGMGPVASRCPTVGMPLYRVCEAVFAEFASDGLEPVSLCVVRLDVLVRQTHYLADPFADHTTCPASPIAHDG